MSIVVDFKNLVRAWAVVFVGLVCNREYFDFQNSKSF